jgi:uncharacterized protein (DUF608 family)
MNPLPEPNACGPGCGCAAGVNRRAFLARAGAGAAGLLASAGEAVAGPFEGKDFDKLVPADKKLRPAWLAALTRRGEPAVWRGPELDTVGMPVGGIGAGQLYLGGDGRLWHWDVFNLPQPAGFGSTAGVHYAHPPRPSSPVAQGFAVKVVAGGKTGVRPLDRRGFRDISFRGQYPVAFVDYRDADLPVAVTLEAFSPFIPLDVASSTLPATVLHFTLKNTGSQPVTVELAGWLENAVCRDSGRHIPGRRRYRVLREPGLTVLFGTAEREPHAEAVPRRPDVLFEDFEKERYDGWKVEGTAFGSGPVRRADIPAYQGNVGGEGRRVVNSHASAPGKDVAARDAQTGKLTSKPFRIERNYITFYIGGGSHAGRTCMNLVVDGKPVRTEAGRDSNRMRPAFFDVRDLQGKEAVLEIVDAEPGPWGNVGVDHIVFSDAPAVPLEPEKQADFGSLALALLGDAPGTFARARLPLEPHEAAFADSAAEADEAVQPLPGTLVGALGRRWTLQPGERAGADFVLAWYFPALPPGRFDQLADGPRLRRSYAGRFDSAAAVARHVAKDFDRLAGQTRLWNRTWYDSTLPYWLLDRAFWPLCCLATATCYHFDNGRFYGFEGTYCCEGTCTHVWQYAQGLARIFPQIERDTRERVDFGLAFHPDTGAMDYRGEYGRRVAHDGQAGTVLRAYREHLTAPDDAYLRRTWPKIRQALEYLVRRDTGRDGLLDGEQYNTLDASWYGHIAWISSLYLAAVRAGAAMAREVGDEASARRYEALAERGGKRLTEGLFNGEYFTQVLDPGHPEAINSNDGCHIDQVLGQAWAFQVGLPRVLPQGPTFQALESLWKYNFTPDVGPYRERFKAIPGGRWYAMPGEGGLLMCTWPRGGAEKAAGKGDPGFVAYFNECMAGFEYQVAAHMVWEGLVEKGLALARTVHDRYAAGRRNPFNDVECSDHYARAMSSYGIFLAACGFGYHGPEGHLAFAPRLTPEDFRAPFTAAAGWGTFGQKRDGSTFTAVIDLKWGKLRLRTLALEVPEKSAVETVRLRANGRAVEVKHQLQGRRLLLTLPADVTIDAGQKIEAEVAGNFP